jgi:hypothetical protein
MTALSNLTAVALGDDGQSIKAQTKIPKVAVFSGFSPLLCKITRFGDVHNPALFAIIRDEFSLTTYKGVCIIWS